MSVPDIIAIFCRIINFGNKTNIISLFHLRDHPVPEFNRNHFRHIAPETVYPFFRPEKQDIQHLRPCIGNRIKMQGTAVHIINTIIQLDRLIPVVLSGTGTEAIVPRDFRRKFTIFKIFLLSTELQAQSLPRYIIEIIIRIESFRSIVFLPQVFHICHLGIRIILAGHMIRYEIDDYFHSGFMRPSDQRFEFFHTVRHIISQVRVYIIIIFDRIRRAGIPLYDCRMVSSYLVSRIISIRCMFDHSGIPDMGGSQLLNLGQSNRRKVRKLSYSVFNFTSILHQG